MFSFPSTQPPPKDHLKCDRFYWKRKKSLLFSCSQTEEDEYAAANLCILSCLYQPYLVKEKKGEKNLETTEIACLLFTLGLPFYNPIFACCNQLFGAFFQPPLTITFPLLILHTKTLCHSHLLY